MNTELTEDDLIGARVALKDAEQDNQYSTYIGIELEKLPLLNLWDSCFLAAIGIFYNREIPDAVQGLDWKELGKAIEKDIDDDTPALLLPLQQWICDQITISLKENEIRPLIIGRFINGQIDPKRTYIELDVLDDWFIIRGIHSIFDETEHFSDALIDSFSRLHDAVLAQRALLSAKLYSPNIELSDIIPKEEHIDVHLENWRLKGLLKRQSLITPQKRSSHGNAERFAKNREQVLGAAIHVITHWPEKCRNSSGKFEATKIANIIDSKSGLFWPDTGEPPLNRQKIEREISKWINSTVK
jgi:hypothetical protein